MRQLTDKKASSTPLINGLSPVNCGVQFTDGKYTFEVMSKDFSNHSANIVSIYIKDGKRKVEISCWVKDFEDYKNVMFGVAHYNSFLESSSYSFTNEVSPRYKKYKEILIEAHREIFKGQVGKNLEKL